MFFSTDRSGQLAQRAPASDEIARGRAAAPASPRSAPSIRRVGRPPDHPDRRPRSPRNPRSSWLGPAEGRAGSSRPSQEITPMTVVAHELKASYAFIERNFYLTRRYWGWEVAFLVYSVAGALSISLIGADAGQRRRCS